MKKYILGGIVVVLLGGYALWSASRSQTPAPVGTTSIPSETTNPGTTSQGAYKDGTYTGSIGSAAPYGNVQVKATVSGGKISAIEMLAVPHGPGYTDELSASTFPKLVQQAITVQSAKVDIISGATQNSEGFTQSLAAALATAKN
ncbi:MAG: FMN-binding protein [Candidatus Adlerbacteria bacterium]|nr:FMN-binding protein [Candidatus Adlerbacteria bacterium]